MGAFDHWNCLLLYTVILQLLQVLIFSISMEKMKIVCYHVSTAFDWAERRLQQILVICNACEDEQISVEMQDFLKQVKYRPEGGQLQV